MKDVLSAIGYLPELKVKQSSVYNRLQTIRYSTTRNRLAASIAFVWAILFLVCGYKADIEIYNQIGAEVLSIESLRLLWNMVIIPIGLLAILSQLGGIIMMGAGLFAADRVNLGKLLAMVGTGLGLFTIAVHILVQLWSGELCSVNNYVRGLTSTLQVWVYSLLALHRLYLREREIA